MDVHSMMFVGFGFLMTFLKRYGYSSISYNFIIAAFVLEWAVLVRGFIHGMSLNVQSILVSDFCAAAVLISFGAVLGKTSLIQLIVMSFVEVAVQILNETFCVEYLKVSDVGGSIFVHVFGAFFGLAVAKVINTKKVEDPNHKEGSNYHSDLFSMIGTIFLWIYWVKFNYFLFLFVYLFCCSHIFKIMIANWIYILFFFSFYSHHSTQLSPLVPAKTERSLTLFSHCQRRSCRHLSSRSF